jgi:CubicO group peptidase (beta-lactamase class C family)
MLTDVPEGHGISSACTTEFLSQIEAQDLRVNGLIVMRDGYKLLETYRRPYEKDYPQLLFSLTNMFLSAAVGIACDSGLFSLEDRVVSFFRDKLGPDVSPYQYEMRIRHLLEMNTGHRGHNFHIIYPQTDWVEGFLDIPPEHQPGTHYCYSKHASHVLAAIVERTSGQALVNFLMPRLFRPLGITQISWENAPSGISAGGMGLSVPTEGVARLGQMFLDKGIYDGRRILSEEYVNLATTKKSEVSGDGSVTGYGYHVQLFDHGCFGHEGSFGQLCFVAPAKRVVVAVTSAKRNFQQITDLVYRCLLDRCVTEHEQVVPGTPDIRGSELGVLKPLIRSAPTETSWVPSFTRATIETTDNPEGIEQVVVLQTEGRISLGIAYRNKPNETKIFGLTRPVYASEEFVRDVALHLQPVIRYAKWCSAAQLELVSIYPETPYITTHRVSFDNATNATIEFSVNISLGNFSPMSTKAFSVAGKRTSA